MSAAARRKPLRAQRWFALCPLVFALALAGCAPAAVAPSSTAHSGRPSGPAHVELADPNVHPVAGDLAPQLPATVRSFDGRQVTVRDVSRILAVDLHGTLAETVFTLGLGANVVGRDSSTGFPQAAHLPLVTVGGHALSAEAILALHPTVVLTDTSIGPPEVATQLRAAGIPVVLFDPSRSLAGIAPQISAVAGALGVPARGERLVERVMAEIAQARAGAADRARPVRIAFLYLRGTAVALLAGKGSGADALIDAIGAVDVGQDIGIDRPFVPLTSEALIAAQPDVILMMTDGLASVRGIDGLLAIPGIAQTPAGQHRRIVDMPDSELLSFGPRTGQTIQALAAAVYGAR